MLKGAGVALGLPFLESMVPALSAAPKATPRLGFLYVPHGAVMDQFTPVGQGRDFEFSQTLKSLEPFRDRVNIVTGLAQHMADSLGDGGADHARATATWLTSVHAKRTEGEDVRAGTSIDQIAAAKIGQDTQFPSIEVATEDMTGLIGACDSGYSCAYMNTISWRTPTTPNPMEINPRVVFERLFGDGSSAEERLQNLKDDRSILDSLTGSVGRLKTQLGGKDRTRMEEFTENIREIERRLQLAEKNSSVNAEIPDQPVGVPDTYDEHVKLLLDLQTVAFQADLTRVFTFMLAREVSQRSYPMVGVPDPHHATSHHMNDPVKIAKLVKINGYHASLVAYFLDKLKKSQDGEGNLLDNSMILYGSCLSNSNIHNHSPLPTVLAGGAAGRLQGGRHLIYPEQTPMANLLVSMLHKVDVNVDKVGDSTGPLAEL